MEKVKLTTKEVAWSGNKTTKYQTMFEYTASNNRIIRLIGDPQSSEEKAMDSALNEVMLWDDAVKEFRKFIKAMQSEGAEDSVKDDTEKK